MDNNLTNSNNNWQRPIRNSLLIIVGIIIGSFIFRGHGPVEGDLSKKTGGGGKVDNVLDFIVRNYVDTLNRNELEDKTLTDLLTQLDPHSQYIPAIDLKEVNEPLQGNFDGIGIEFNIVSDTIRVVHTIEGGPSQRVGVKAGDRIVKVDGQNVAGVKITNKKVFEKLRGSKGTKVNVDVKREGVKGLVNFVITRGGIPIFSVDAAFIAAQNTGYIKISRFAASTIEEFQSAFNKLSSQGMRQLILDLRGNGGGYLNTAVDLADEFLSKGMLIVYTKGNHSQKHTYFATDKGGFENKPLVILIDEGSASASEIVAGALQDNDRAILVGRRSFGKGLVQEQIEIPDGSALRLTTARYYTPSGRCIQKPYNKGLEAYYNEEYDRFENGEMLSADSIHFADSLRFKTVSGKTVYGGGGIMPDIFVPLDTSYRTAFLNKVLYKGVINDFAFAYSDQHRNELLKFKEAKIFVKEFVLIPDIFKAFMQYADKNGCKAEENAILKSKGFISNQLKALIGRNIFDSEAFYPVILNDDKVFNVALRELGVQKK